MAHDPMLPAGSRYCLCRGCGLYFGGDSAFRAHRAEGRCRSPEELTSLGYRLNGRGYWGQDYKRPKRPKVALPDNSYDDPEDDL